MKRLFLLVITSLVVLLEINAQGAIFTSRNYNEINLSSSKFNPFFYASAFNGISHAYYRFSSMPNAEEFANAKLQGVKFLDYIPNNIYLLAIPANEAGLKFLSHSKIISAINFEKGKFSNNLLQQFDLYRMAIEESITCYVYCYEDITLAKFENTMSSYGQIVSRSEVFHRFTLIVKPGMLNPLSLNPAIKLIDNVPPTPVADNLPGRTNHRSNILGSSIGRNLQGDSLVLGEWDGEGAGRHLDIDTPRVRRMSPYVNNGNGAHATHVCGTMAGAGIINPFALGMAPKAKVLSWNFYGDVTAQMDSSARYYNMTITQNSYGYGDAGDPCPTRGKYDDVSRELDILVRTYPNMIHVFAAGNSQSLCGLGGFRTVFSGFQSAKNVITIGALTSQDAMSSFSSWGPIRDGRLKPEVCAVGVNVFSTQNANLYAGGWNGTSMACPGASGTIAQLVQRYHQLNLGMDPLASLIRAIVSNTADDLFNAGPDFKSGFGRINGLTAVKTIEQKRYKIDSVGTGNFKVDSFFASAGLHQIKVMLAWSDKEAVALASRALVNDLDLYVITPLNDTLRPWRLDTANFNGLAIRGIDSINNIEQVTLDAPVQGYYKMYVQGRAVPFGPQVYALTYEHVAKAITITYPNGGEMLEPSKAQVVRWDATGVGSTCNIEYSLNNGVSWIAMVYGIATSLKNYSWGVPNINTSQALVRIAAGSYTDRSDSVFSILPVIDSIKGVICDKQVTLKWKKITGVTSYDVMQVINGSMQSVALTTDTFYTIRNLNNGVAYWFSIRGKFNNNYGERAIAVTFTPGISPLPPTVTRQPFSPPVCSGALVTLISKATGTSSILQQWQISLDTGKTFINIPLANDTMISFTVNTSMNNTRYRCFYYNACQNFQFTDTVTLFVDTVLKYVQQPQNLTLCSGADGQFFASAPSNSGTIYQWQYNDGINGWQDEIGATTNILSITNASTIKDGWQFRLIASNACTQNLLSNIVTLSVRAPLNVTATGGKTICYGISTTLNAIASGGNSSKYTYSWSLNGTLVQRAFTSALTISPTLSGTYKVMVWDSCSSQSLADSDSVIVNVLPPLTIAADNDKIVCNGNTITLMASGAGGNGNYTYGWLRGNSLIQYSKSNTLTITPSTSTTYKVFVSDSCTPRKDTATIFVAVREALHVVKQVIPDTSCIGAQATITAIPSGGDSTYVYTFINANTNLLIQSGTNPTLTTAVLLNNNFILVLSDSCTKLNDTLRFKIPLRNKLGVTISKSPVSNVCSNNPVQLTANPTGGALSNFSYEWRKSGSTAVIGTTKQITVNTPVSSRFSVTINDGCTIASASDSTMVTIETPNPIFTSSYSSGKDYVYFSAAQSGYKKYFWDFGDGDTTSEFEPNHQYRTKGSYKVCLKITSFNNCDSDYCDSVHVYFNNGINKVAKNIFRYAPNPFENEIYLDFETTLPLQIKLIDAVGKEQSFISPIQKSTVLSTGNLSSGNYILQLVFKDEVSYMKMIKR